MLFLTFIQGPKTTKCVHSISNWLELLVQATHEYDLLLWDNTELAFNCKFGDVLSQERAIAELNSSIKMEGGDLDGFINHFELLVCHAGYRLDDSLVLQKFTDGLPFGMYKMIYEGSKVPQTYQGWCDAAIAQQKKFVHMKG